MLVLARLCWRDPIAIAESLLSLFKCVLSDHRSLFQGWPSQGFSAVSNPAHCLNITVSSRPSKICHLHWNNATSKLCFWESFGSKWNAAWNILSLYTKVSAKYNASCISFIKHQVVLLSLDRYPLLSLNEKWCHTLKDRDKEWKIHD